MIEIKRWNGQVLYTAKNASDVRAALTEAVAARADLRGADLTGADLRGADLTGADLRGAYLTGADLTRADLTGADLRGAYLRGAYLRGAKGINAHRTTPLLVLHDQVGKIRAYKLVTADGRSPIQTSSRLTYAKGETLEVLDANTDPMSQCAAGINVATLDWCMANWSSGCRILVVEFSAKDIAVIPTATDGKFRLHRCKVVGEKDLAEIGLIEAEAEVA